MKPLLIVLTAAVLCLGAAVPSFADHHEKASDQEGQAGMPPMGPPPEMKQLEIMNGEYEVNFWFKMDPSSEEWSETKATADISMVAGGGAQQLIWDGQMMGMPFRGLGLTSYDRETGSWQMVWVDSMGARISTYTGDFKDGKLVVTGKDMGQGMTYHSRLSTYNINEQGFDWKYEMSMDGTSFVEGAKATYRKKN